MSMITVKRSIHHHFKRDCIKDVESDIIHICSNSELTHPPVIHFEVCYRNIYNLIIHTKNKAGYKDLYDILKKYEQNIKTLHTLKMVMDVCLYPLRQNNEHSQCIQMWFKKMAESLYLNTIMNYFPEFPSEICLAITSFSFSFSDYIAKPQ